MPAPLVSRRDLAFLLYDWLDAPALCARERFADHSRETFDAVLDLADRIASDHFAPINRLLDTDEPRFDGERVVTPAALKTAVRAYCEAGLLAAGFDHAAGGMQLPRVVQRASELYFNAASVGAGVMCLTPPNASTLLLHATARDRARYVPALLAGRFSGTMCLSEPQAGSSLADIRTRAVPQADGTYRLYGNKMWISGGDHDCVENIVHLVLAKVPGPDGRPIPGTRGISLFVVPKFLVNDDGTLGARNDVAVAGLNHKLGWRGLPNCAMNFGEGRYLVEGAPGAVGTLVGTLHNGLACMFHMMNDARIMIGNVAAGLAYAGYLHALDYARTRTQGRLPGAKDPAMPPVRIIEHADVRRMLLQQKCYAEGAAGLVLYCARLVDEQMTAADAGARAEASHLLDLLTPVAKSWPSQFGQEANSLAIQVHGGYGYTRDFAVEQFWRDQRLNPIHEGTQGIHAVDLLGRKVRLEGGAALEALWKRVAATVDRAAATGGEWRSAGESLEQWRQRIVQTIRMLHAADGTDRTLANADAFLEAFGHWTVAWVWLEQALVADRLLAGAAEEDERAFLAGKQQAARWFLRRELPRIGPLLDALDALDMTAAEMRDAWF